MKIFLQCFVTLFFCNSLLFFFLFFLPTFFFLSRTISPKSQQRDAVIQGLKDVRVRIPPTVKRLDTVTLTCTYDLEEDTLYSVKWYRGRKEFYRYTPNEDPEMKVFHVAGVHVVVSMSRKKMLMKIMINSNSTLMFLIKTPTQLSHLQKKWDNFSANNSNLGQMRPIWCCRTHRQRPLENIHAKFQPTFHLFRRFTSAVTWRLLVSWHELFFPHLSLFLALCRPMRLILCF